MAMGSVDALMIELLLVRWGASVTNEAGLAICKPCQGGTFGNTGA